MRSPPRSLSSAKAEERVAACGFSLSRERPDFRFEAVRSSILRETGNVGNRGQEAQAGTTDEDLSRLPSITLPAGLNHLPRYSTILAYVAAFGKQKMQRVPAGSRAALAGITAVVVGKLLDQAVEEVGYDRGGEVCAGALRAVALGRKNYLSAGSDAGGERAAALYSLIGTAKLNSRDPEASLREVLSRIADHPINRIEELLPWNVVRPDQRLDSK